MTKVDQRYNYHYSHMVGVMSNWICNEFISLQKKYPNRGNFSISTAPEVAHPDLYLGNTYDLACQVET